MVGAHRVSWTLLIGLIPREMHVLHKCDNPLCVNPDHLFLGNNQDNVRDKMQKRRHFTGERKRGSDCRWAKLTEKDVIDIRNRNYSVRGSKSVTAKEYGISASSVTWILKGRNWQHI